MQENTHKPFVLVDGSAYLFRAFHALPPLMNSKGEPTGAIYGVVSMLKKLLAELDPTYVAVVFDTPEPNFRHALYEEYKATRKETPPELVTQFPILVKVIQSMGLPVLQIKGVEADDVMGTLTHMAKNEGWKTIISTSDKDLAQLVDQDVQLINTMTDVRLDEQGVIDKFGVKPNQIIDYLALMGDTSDNIPGIPQVGPKTAAKWLLEYGDLENVIKNADQIKGKVGESLRTHLDLLPLSKKLVTLKLDVPLTVHITDLKKSPPDQATLNQYFRELEFKKWLVELEQDHPKEPEHPCITILDQASWLTWIEKLKKSKLFSIASETTALSDTEKKLVGISMATAEETVYIPFSDIKETTLDPHQVLKALKPLLEDHAIKKVVKNIKYEWSTFLNYGIDLCHVQFDTMLESYVYNSIATRHNLDELSSFYLHQKKPATENADVILQLHHFFWPELQKSKELTSVFSDIEMPCALVIAKMEQYGVLIDPHLLKTQSDELDQKIKQIELEVYGMAGIEFNIASPKQLQEILFTRLKLPSAGKTPTGQPSTGESVLQELALEYPLPALILQYRSLSKLKSTYTDSLPEQIDPSTGRIHTSYHQAITATGRLSSSDPNLQNIPIRTAEGRRIRQAFIAPPGHKIVAADYSQIELRIMAHLSGDVGLCHAFEQGLDIHRATAAEVFNVSLEQVSSEQRRTAKAINFGLIYGMSAFGLSKQIKLPREVAQQYINNYFTRYPLVKTYMENTRKQAAEIGYVSTLFGRRLYLPEINAGNHLKKMAAERTAINAPMQGTAADIIKRAMIIMDQWLSQHPNVGHMVMQVHDELVFEIAAEQVKAFTPILQKTMSEAAHLRVPLVVDIGVGNNWDEAH